MNSSSRFWAVVPAAGRASRMGESAVPKQYLRLAGRTVLEWSLAPLLAHADCAGVFVALAAGDRHWQELAVSRDARVNAVEGGAQRTDSVRAGLRALQERADDRDWVLVHDAARPCLAAEELARLIAQVRDDDVGGLLAVPLVDTLKRADGAGRVAQTVSRDALWRALTPQMFRYGVLDRALAETMLRGIPVTDEAQAVELLGLHPQLVVGSADNIKITLPDDVPRAERILQSRAL
ncbi:MAG TPA: 2-C-methyl-D-erythritol 4-phosphate cytidylyltransferase [Povalibacter sp.]|nr:2-C-methyl-D-erythritol 4-phosphate cytidylyltransferase [Povalibacter sp.]